MGNYICFLITVLYEAEGTTLNCALRIKRSALTGDCEEYPMEPENRRKLHSILPQHVRSAGPIIKVEPLFEVCEYGS